MWLCSIYSGHGAQEKADPAFWNIEPDHLNETIICYDSRQPGSWDLADKELAQLIHELAAKNPQIVVVLDSCHSGSGTRAIEIVGVRRGPTDQRERPLNTYLMTPAQAEALAKPRPDTETDWFNLLEGRHVLLAACRSNEEAKELKLGGQHRGVFSYYLTETLRQYGPSLSYHDLFKRINTLVRNQVGLQSPQVEANHLEDLDKPFLGGAFSPQKSYYTLSFDPQKGWVIDGGAVHGIPPVNLNETTRLALFPITTSIEDLRTLKGALGEAMVTEVQANLSKVQLTLENGKEADKSQTYKAVITSLPLKPLGVKLEGDPTSVEQLRRALATSGVQGGPSLYLHEDEAGELAVTATPELYQIRRLADAYPLVVNTPNSGRESADQVVEKLEHIARWNNTLHLANPASRLPQNAVSLEIYVEKEPGSGEFGPQPGNSEIRLEYFYQKGKWEEPRFRVKLKNNTDQELYCALYDLTSRYAIDPFVRGVRLPAGVEIYVGEEYYQTSEVPEELWKEGITEIKDVLKLIVCTEEFDASLITQGRLEVAVKRAINRSADSFNNMLERLMSRVQTRELNNRPKNENKVEWLASEVSFNTYRPLEAVEIPTPGKSSNLASNVRIAGHPRLRGQARLTHLPQAGRDLGNLSLPAIFRDSPGETAPFEFSSSRGGEPGLSVLELILPDGNDYTLVTDDEPLKLTVITPLAENEELLPYGFDGEFYLPLGYATRQGEELEINLERLPAPTSSGTRDLKGSIKILFQKIVGDKLGSSYTYPLLASANLDWEGQIEYNVFADEVKAKIADKTTRHILLYIHGITGDTKRMAASAWHARYSLAEHYDLILTFDYENIQTSIEDTARSLKARLAEIGLGEGHSKALHIAAHSMGGLVARWFIEREGGNKQVQHLVMLGTPNGGSPWASIEQWATLATGIGLNLLSQIVWPVKVLGGIISATNTFKITLKQMKTDSTFLKSLATSPDPGIKYTVLAGNTSIIPAALEEDSAKGSPLKRLTSRLFPKNLPHEVLSLAFSGEPNDIAVSVKSVKNLPLGRNPAPILKDVACDHLTYFVTEAGLEALVKSLTPE